MKVDLFKPNDFTAEWLQELEKTFKSGMIAQAGKVEEFENEFGKKFDYEYQRCGCCNIFLASEPLSGKRFVKVTERRTKKDWADFVEDIALK